MPPVSRQKLSPVLAESLQHGARVAHFAKALFTELAPLHALGPQWLHILDLGAKLHDIGWLHGKQAHNKVSAAMIRAGAISETQPLPLHVPKKIRPLVAMVARYHRRAEPSLTQARFAALSSKKREAINILAAFIRLADALDFSHTGAVQDIQISILDKSILLKLICTKNCQAEVLRVAVKKELFCKIFQRDVVCSATLRT